MLLLLLLLLLTQTIGFEVEHHATTGSEPNSMLPKMLRGLKLSSLLTTCSQSGSKQPATAKELPKAGRGQAWVQQVRMPLQ